MSERKPKFDTSVPTKSVTEKATKRLQLLRDCKTKIVCRSIWLRINNICPPEFQNKKYPETLGIGSMHVSQVKSAIDHFPSSVETIGISGGEPFTTPKLLKQALALIQQRNFPNLTQTTVQTIGNWATDRKKTKQTIKELIALGINHFNVYGAELWNLQNGLQPACHQLVCNVLRDEFGAISPQTISKLAEVEYIFMPDAITFSYRANGYLLQIDTSNSRPSTIDSIDLNRNGYIYTIGVDGTVHCGNQIHEAPLGNIFERPLSRILQTARQRVS